MKVIGDMIPDQLFFRSAYEPQPVVLPVIVPKIPGLTPSPVITYVPKKKKENNLLYYILIPVALYVLLK
jgi:hypothetical protein